MDRKSAMLTARKELVMALYELGMSFLKGWGVTRDKVVAFSYFKLAADLVRTKYLFSKCALDILIIWHPCSPSLSSFNKIGRCRFAKRDCAVFPGRHWYRKELV